MVLGAGSWMLIKVLDNETQSIGHGYVLLIELSFSSAFSLAYPCCFVFPLHDERFHKQFALSVCLSPPPSLSLFLHFSLSLSLAPRKSKRQRGRTLSSFVTRANPRFVRTAVFYRAYAQRTPVSVYRKQVLSIRRGKINKWRS